MKTIAYIFIGFIAALWIYTLAVDEPPYRLPETPRTVDEITLQEVNKYR